MAESGRAGYDPAPELHFRAMPMSTTPNVPLNTPAARQPGSKVGKFTVTAARCESMLGRRYDATEAGGSAVTLTILSERLAIAGAEGEQEVSHELQASRRVRHPRLAVLLFAGRDGGEIYAVHEGTGTTAAEVLAAGPADLRSACRWARDAAEGLDAIHDAGLVHRGLRPECLIIGADGAARLGGLGLSCAAELLTEARMGVPVADPLYTAPEFYRDGKADPRSDVYSLGAVLYHLLTGEPPFTAGTSMQVLHAHVSRPAADPRKRRPDVPASAAAAVARAMAKAPADRYRSAAEMAEALTAVLEELPEPAAAPAEAVPQFRPGPKAASRAPAALRPAAKPGVGRFVVPAVVGVLAIGAGVWWMTRPGAGPAKDGAASKAKPKDEPAAGTGADAPAGTRPGGEAVEPGPSPVAQPPVAIEEPEYAVEFRRLTERADKARSAGPAESDAAAAALKAFAAKHKDGGGVRSEFAAQAAAAAALLARPAPPELPATPTTEAQDPNPISSWQDLSVVANAVTFSPDGTMLAVVGGALDGNKGEIAVRSLTENRVLFARGAHEGPVTSVAFSPDSTMLLTAGGTSARLYNAKTGEQLAAFLCRFRAHAAAVSPDGKTIAVADGAFIQLYEVRGKQPRGERMAGHGEWINALAFSPDSAWLVSAGADNTVRIWNVAERTEAKVLQGHTSWIHGLAFSPDGSQFASASRDQTVRLWKMPDGAPSKVLAGHFDRAWSVTFSPDGKRAASAGSFDRTLRVWDLAAGSAVVFFRAHGGKTTGVAWSPDGLVIATCGDDKQVKLWKAPK